MASTAIPDIQPIEPEQTPGVSAKTTKKKRKAPAKTEVPAELKVEEKELEALKAVKAKRRKKMVEMERKVEHEPKHDFTELAQMIRNSEKELSKNVEGRFGAMSSQVSEMSERLSGLKSVDALLERMDRLTSSIDEIKSIQMQQQNERGFKAQGKMGFASIMGSSNSLF